ncbi:hypothetical protein SAMN05216167_11914 [Spirosoma endophyticum]|uniref:Uncharacterized protein n=1 Tax=Spirosoma endophyticum TaxID=662367 RepID=A0A1I2D6N2_9BACT|nr:hypothetical protein SAMN05216167_11914 [Spirosoma endophyticum]
MENGVGMQNHGLMIYPNLFENTDFIGGNN